MWIQFAFIDNKWCFNNKNDFTTIRVVWASGGSGLKPQNGQFKVFLPTNFKAHKKKVSKIYLVNWVL